ncbi:unnamed protein product [Ectocarpus sp. 12 AP-2014]
MALAVADNAVQPHTDHKLQEQQDPPNPKDPSDPNDPVLGSVPAALHCDRTTMAGGLDSISYGNVGGSNALLPVPTRRGLDSSPALFLWESRTTTVDVMSVSNTTRPVVVSSSRNSERRRIQVVLPYGVGSGAAGGTAGNGGGHRGGSASGRAGAAGTMMSLPDLPNPTALEARLNEDRRVKRGWDLRRERHAFLSRLTQEREERVLLEAWAASMIQALFRGFLARPRPPRPRPRKELTPAESNRRLVADLQAILARAGLPTIPGLGPDGRKASEGTAWGQGRGGATSGHGGGGMVGAGGRGLKRSRSRRQRAFEDEMSTHITRVVRGFLERRRFGRRWAVWDRKRRWASASRIQNCWRAYRKRMGWRELESEATRQQFRRVAVMVQVMDRAAAKIQARWRGVACRMGLARKATDDALGKRRMVSAVTIQAAARRRAAIVRYGSKLTLGAARREREARAAAEAARPRRRWNRGGGTGGTTGAAAGTAASATSEGGEAARGRAQPARGGETGRREAAAAVVGVAAVAGSEGGRDKEQRTTAAATRNAGGKGRGAEASTSTIQLLELQQEDQQQKHEGPAHGSETGLSNQKAGLSPTGVGSADGSGGGGGTGLCGGLSSDVRKRASQEASLQFVQESIQAAVVSARKHSVEGTGSQ